MVDCRVMADSHDCHRLILPDFGRVHPWENREIGPIEVEVTQPPTALREHTAPQSFMSFRCYDLMPLRPQRAIPACFGRSDGWRGWK